MSKRRFILTGPPGIGKTTIVKTVCSSLRQLDVPINGFYTEELRENGQRIGFDVINVDGKRGALARVLENDSNFRKVGKYSVMLEEFESIVLPIFQKIDNNTRNLLIIDEIGKMELFSNKFVSEVNRIFQNSNLIILATIPISKGKPIPLVERVRNDSKNELLSVNTTNRNEIPQILSNSIMRIFK